MIIDSSLYEHIVNEQKARYYQISTQEPLNYNHVNLSFPQDVLNNHIFKNSVQRRMWDMCYLKKIINERSVVCILFSVMMVTAG